MIYLCVCKEGSKWAVWWVDKNGLSCSRFKTKKEAEAFAIRFLMEVEDSVYVSPAYFWDSVVTGCSNKR